MDKRLVKLLERFCDTRAAKSTARILQKHKSATLTVLYDPDAAISAINNTATYQAEITGSNPSGTVVRVKRKTTPSKHQA